MPMAPHKLETQARACAEALAALLWQVFVNGSPADRVLAEFLRQHHEYGARDRRLVSESLFAVLRWWGWLRPLAPPTFLQALPPRPIGTATSAEPQRERAGAPAVHDREWSKILLAAHLLEDGPLPPVTPVWCRAAHVELPALDSLPSGPDRVEKRARAVFRTIEMPTPPPLSLTDLVPDWVFEETRLPCPRTQLIQWFQRRPPVWLRAQTPDVEALLREFRENQITCQRHPTLLNALRLAPVSLNLRALSAYRSGHFEVQDLASQVIGLTCAPSPGERWWDACAGAGGKSLQLADLLQRRGTVMASDSRVYKLDDLRLRARRGGFPNIQCREWHGQPVAARKATFDGVLVDAPCSCSGTWRRNPDARWTSTREEIDELVTLQLRLLRGAATGVKPGGRLVYATCSLFHRENEGVIDAFLRDNAAFTLEPFTHPLTSEPTPGMAQVWPWQGDCDAMFAARLQRKN